MNNTIAISSNTAWSLFNFRGGLIRTLISADFRVVVLAPVDDYSVRLAALGCEVIDLPMDNKGSNPLHDGSLALAYRREFRRLRPAISLHYTIKPVIYGSIAARSLGIPCVNMITGLGTAFIRDNWLTRVVESLYRVSQRQAERIFFLNEEDQKLFLERQLVPVERVERLPGEGINLEYFSPTPYPASEHICFLLIARLLRDKGVVEFVEAARKLRHEFPQARFQLLGPIGVANRTAIERETLDSWVAEGVVEYLGETDDVRPFISQAKCLVLPSYREGVPRTLLEGAAMERPIIATDTVGCRDVVDDGVNGFLCRVQDAGDLAEKMRQFIQQPITVSRAQGSAGRLKVMREFDERLVIDRYLEVIDVVVNGGCRKAQF
jgi:glycosyltransferase involved in cell wall biosynthesis